MLRVKDSPVPAVSESHKDKIVHANIRIDGVELAGADVDASRYVRPAGLYVLVDRFGVPWKLNYAAHQTAAR